MARSGVQCKDECQEAFQALKKGNTQNHSLYTMHEFKKQEAIDKITTPEYK